LVKRARISFLLFLGALAAFFGSIFNSVRKKMGAPFRERP
jgi:hypothetical protein